MMGYINFEDHALIKRWWVGKKKNVMDKMFKDEKNRVIVKISLRLLWKLCAFSKFESSQ
jgi:hypothetical protein